MIQRVMKYSVKPEKLAEAHSAAAAFVEEVVAREPGTLFYTACQIRTSFSFIHFMTFSDAKAAEKHAESAHLRRLFQELYPISDDPPRFEELKVIAAKS
jgi:quinol monooxygenase YgiN